MQKHLVQILFCVKVKDVTSWHLSISTLTAFAQFGQIIICYENSYTFCFTVPFIFEYESTALFYKVIPYGMEVVVDQPTPIAL